MAEPRGRPGRLEGRPLSPRAFRPFGVEALLVGASTVQEGLVRREGVAVWRRLPEHAPVFDRLAATAEVEQDGLLPVRVVVAVTPARDRAMRVPATGERAARVLAAAESPVPDAGWVLLVDEGPGETWLYLAEEDDPAAAPGSAASAASACCSAWCWRSTAARWASAPPARRSVGR
jgi:hypothetical protein